MKRCSSCNVEKPLSEFYKDKYSRDGKAHKCSECSAKASKVWRINNPIRHRLTAEDWKSKCKSRFKEVCAASRRKPGQRFSAGKCHARRRGLRWGIGFEEYVEIISELCVYCRGYFQKEETGVGLDRLDNSLGYELGNVVSCCGFCNRFRGDKMSPVECEHLILALIRFRNTGVFDA
jgi:hypothetical protein